ncbi:hypothetical protein KQJ01_15275, partial [Enterococcus sp. S125_ASV_20]|uniref:hypothetical protein n=1 Tax=Enterococcus sp. S125_ASV_20 TaxID=2846992 RepID=UPI001C1174E5
NLEFIKEEKGTGPPLEVLAGMIGSDSFGAQLKASLNEELTDSQLVRVVPGSSGIFFFFYFGGQEYIYF